MHTPVLLQEVIRYLKPQPGQNFIDATVGDGGHSLAILEKIMPGGKVLGIDWDETAIKNLKAALLRPDGEKQGLRLDTGSIAGSPTGAWEPEPPQDPEGLRHGEAGGVDRSGIEPRSFQSRFKVDSLVLKEGNFADLAKLAGEANFKNAAGALFDLGFRTFQLEESGRGFSYSKNEPLDMRYSLETGLTALEIVNVWSQPELERIFREWGEERSFRKIAARIVQARKTKRIVTTGQLVEVIGRVGVKTLARVFQALRIAVNGELDNVQLGLEAAWQVLGKNGRLAVISFHSLEDRLVKNFFRKQKKDGWGNILTAKPVRPSAEEIKSNPKSRSAKLRVIIKIRD